MIDGMKKREREKKLAFSMRFSEKSEESMWFMCLVRCIPMILVELFFILSILLSSIVSLSLLSTLSSLTPLTPTPPLSLSPCQTREGGGGKKADCSSRCDAKRACLPLFPGSFSFPATFLKFLSVYSTPSSLLPPSFFSLSLVPPPSPSPSPSPSFVYQCAQ